MSMEDMLQKKYGRKSIFLQDAKPTQAQAQRRQQPISEDMDLVERPRPKVAVKPKAQVTEAKHHSSEAEKNQYKDVADEHYKNAEYHREKMKLFMHPNGDHTDRSELHHKAIIHHTTLGAIYDKLHDAEG